jgi:small subunit ribosomal protein S2
MPYVNRRWLGGLLTNFNTIRKRIARLHELRSLSEEGQLDLLPTKERMTMQAELAKLEFNLGGVADMERVPDALLVLDITTEEIALNEANRLGLPIIGLVDTNCDPGPVDHIVPGNDDALRACELVVSTIGSSVEAAASEWKKAEEKRIAEEERRRAEEAEKRRAEEEAAKKREAEEEAAKKEADAKAKKEADAKAKKEADAKAKKESQPAADSGAKQANPASPGVSAKADEPAGQEEPPAEEAQGDTEGGA